MSVIQNIRDKGAGVVIVVIAVALISFILMDAFSNRGGNGGSPTLGKVNGEVIDRKEFEEKVTLYKQNGQPEQQLRTQLWNQEVSQILLREEYKKLGLQYTQKELNSYLTSENPPQWLQGIIAQQNNGAFDPSKVGEVLKNIKNLKGEQADEVYNVYILPTMQEGLQKKYFALLEKSCYAPKWLADKQIADMSAIANAQYVSVPYSSIADSTIKITDDEVEAYAKKHSTEFEQKESARRISYVAFDVKPSAKDTADALNSLLAQKDEFATTTNNKAFIEKYNPAAPYNEFYSAKDKLGGGAYRDSIIKLAPGTVYGPYVDGGNYVLAKYIGSKVWADSAKVRHLLVKTHDANRQTGEMVQVRDEAEAKKLADSLFDAIKKGSNFDSLVIKFSDDDGSKFKGGVYDKIYHGQMMPEFDSYAFSNPVGSRAVVKTAYGYHIMEVLKQYSAKSSAVYNIAFLTKPIVASDETRGAANAMAGKFVADSKDTKTFNDNAAKVQPGGARPSSDIKASDFAVAGIGESRELIDWIYKNDVGDISQPFTIGDKYVVAMLTNIQKAGRMNIASARPLAEPFLRNEKKAKLIIDSKFKGTTLEAVAQSSGTQIQTADSISFVTGFVPNLGQEPKFVGIAFNKSMLNKVSEPIAGTTAVFMVKPTGTATKPAEADATQIRTQLEQQLKNGVGQVTEQLKKIATIKDNRYNY